MATADKDFKIKNGLVVQGTTATVDGYNILTENSLEFLQDTAIYDTDQAVISMQVFG